mmetsp:Transcript_51959/g.166362  ORF Transcript_51959/g.166362 Transcript_51959/m.166362 type:complete len:204 (-) Transcript_51959:1259-1870(-)
MGLPWPSFQLYSSPRGNSSFRSPMALWLTKMSSLPSVLAWYSQAGHLAARAIFRWKTPAPVALRKSSRPFVSTHFQEPRSAGAKPPAPAFAFGFASALAGSASPSESPSPARGPASCSCTVRDFSSLPLVVQETTWSSSRPKVGILFMPSVSCLTTGAFSTVSVILTTPVGLPFLVRVNSLSSSWPISTWQGTVTPPQNTCLW